jgi:cytochrome c oxidase cbb3-type subunit 4
MQTLSESLPLLRSLWVVWFFLMFLGMLWFVLRPSRRTYYEAQGDIPFRDQAAPPGAPRGTR